MYTDKQFFQTSIGESKDGFGKVVCQKHNLEITHLYQGEQFKTQRLYCRHCLQTANHQNLIELEAALSQSQNFAPRVQLFFEMSKNWLESFLSHGKHLIDLYEQQIKLLSEFMESVKNIFLKEQSEITEILNNPERLNNQKLEKLADILNHKNSFPQNEIQEKLVCDQKTFLDKEILVNNELNPTIESFNRKIKSFSNQVSADLEQWEKTLQIDQNIELLEYSQLAEQVITTQNNVVKVFKWTSQQFKTQQIINTNHQKITALVLEQNQNKMYLAGSESLISIWQWRSELHEYQIEKSFSSDETIFKMILDTLTLKIITFSKRQVLVWDLIKFQVHQSLKNNNVENLNQEVMCAEISHCKELIICGISSQLKLWQKKIIWKEIALYKFEFEEQKYVSVCFLNNFQFAALTSKGIIHLYEILESKILNLVKTSYSSCLINAQLRFCKNLKKIILFNDSTYTVFEINTKNEFRVLFKQSGIKIRLCTSSNGEYIVIVNAGNLNLLQFIKFKLSLTKNLRC